MSSTQLAGRTAVVTGAGAGLGRAEALSLAAAGANVVVNDMGPAADTVVEEIKALGVGAVAVRGDVSQWAIGDELVAAAVDTFGSLDIVVNNAGVIRDTMLFNMTEEQWDAVIAVHLKGHAVVSRAASTYWRNKSKAEGGPIFGRLINTASESFLFGSAGQPNYAAAKAGITALTLSAHQGLQRYGVTANVICPRARTAMTEKVFDADHHAAETGKLDILAPERVGTFVSWLASPAAQKVSGQVFVVYGDMVALMAAPVVEQKFTSPTGEFTLEQFDEQLVPHFAERSPKQTYSAYSVAELDTTGVHQL